MDTNTIKAKLILRAIDRYKKISPCGLGSLLDGFTNDSGQWLFWFNVGRNTHMITEGEL